MRERIAVFLRELGRQLQRKPERPQVEVLLRNHEGVAVGLINFEIDGSFRGELDDELFFRKLAEALKTGYGDSVTMTANINPPQPFWKNRGEL